ncbi:hypothetical protein [Streptomyces cavernicola]|uniref:Uncharacterized protein n=1 Tax=Streptomyces cavernicola TaxID=3043613 RepID=A0ABT6SNM9_9ACTN|nr:hypothetical protein [Streptomyces sp. B-S-A6]MDI3408851.1 hypothetical protein [Streptomyces sp. B-S-A6]
MPMPRIPYRLSSLAMAVVGTAPSPRMADRENGVIATDWETGAEFWQLTVMIIDEGRAESMQIQVPNTGLPQGMTVGSTVRLTNLVASPWARASLDNRGQARLSEGCNYRADRLDLLAAAPIQAGAPAAAASAPDTSAEAAPTANADTTSTSKKAAW